MQGVDASIVDCLITHARRTPDATAFVVLEDGEEIEQRITYAPLVVRVQHLAARLNAMQLHGERVLLFQQHPMDFIVSLLACLYAGCIAVPAPYARGVRQLAKVRGILEDAAVKAVIGTTQTIARLQTVQQDYITAHGIRSVYSDEAPAPEMVNETNTPLYNKVAFIQYTSGSVSKPKGVIVSNHSILHNQALIKNTFDCNTHSVILSWLPFHHDMGLIGNILHAIYVGCTCILMPSLYFMQKPLRWLNAVSKYRVTHTGGPNFAYDLCVDNVPAEQLSTLDLSSWEVAYNGSEPVRIATMKRFASYFKTTGFREAIFRPCYGLAEATLLVAGHRSALPVPADPLGRDIVSCGRPAEGMQLRIMRPDGNTAGEELEEGEICIAGPSVSEGYWNNDNNNLFCELEGHPFMRTGDTGFLYAGELFILGRQKEILIIRGRNYYPYDIEQTIAECIEAVNTNGVAAFNINDTEDRLIIVAEIKRSRLKDIDTENIISTIDKLVGNDFGIIPYDIILTTPLAIPRTTSGKRQRVKCIALYTQGNFNILHSKKNIRHDTPDEAQHTALRNKVIEDPVTIHIMTYLRSLIAASGCYREDHPYPNTTPLTALGLDSLKSVELINTINKELNINLDIATVFEDNTLAKLADTIESILWLKNEPVSDGGISI